MGVETGFHGIHHSFAYIHFIYTHMQVYIYIRIYTQAQMYEVIFMYIYIYIHSYIHTYIHTYIHIYIYIVALKYAHIYIYITILYVGRGVACTHVLPIACTRERLLAENRNYTRRIETTREVETSIFSGKIQ